MVYVNFIFEYDKILRFIKNAFSSLCHMARYVNFIFADTNVNVSEIVEGTGGMGTTREATLSAMMKFTLRNIVVV